VERSNGVRRRKGGKQQHLEGGEKGREQQENEGEKRGKWQLCEQRQGWEEAVV